MKNMIKLINLAQYFQYLPILIVACLLMTSGEEALNSVISWK